MERPADRDADFEKRINRLKDSADKLCAPESAERCYFL